MPPQPTITPLNSSDDDDLHADEKTQSLTPHERHHCPTCFHRNSSQSLNARPRCVVAICNRTLLLFAFDLSHAFSPSNC
uniref:Uncharacterized protein n=1 Tax=Cucumis melo TaxID=3656 RepID=A0A9I9EFK2_CUCME